MINLLISGIYGRLGQTVLECAKNTPDVRVCAGVDTAKSDAHYDFPVYSNIADVKENVDVIIDFSRPAALKGIIEFAKKTNTAAVLATTGYTKEHTDIINECGKHIPIFFSANMSLGVNLLKELIKKDIYKDVKREV